MLDPTYKPQISNHNAKPNIVDAQFREEAVTVIAQLRTYDPSYDSVEFVKVMNIIGLLGSYVYRLPLITPLLDCN